LFRSYKATKMSYINRIYSLLIGEKLSSRSTRPFIHWYTLPSGPNRSNVMNKALYERDQKTVDKYSCIINEIKLELQELADQQWSERVYIQYLLNVYRGQIMSRTNFEKLMSDSYGIICFYGFLSTSTEETVAYKFVQIGLHKDNDQVHVIFHIRINESNNQHQHSYAYIGDVSAIRCEREVLFQRNSLFKVQSITYENDIHYVELLLIEQSSRYMEYFTKQIQNRIMYEYYLWHKTILLLVKRNILKALSVRSIAQNSLERRLLIIIFKKIRNLFFFYYRV